MTARVVGIWLLLIPGALIWQPVLGGLEGFIPACVGVTVGCILGWCAAKMRVGPLLTFIATAAMYFLLGGVVALADTTIGGVVPTFDTFKRLALATIHGWRDILTVATPAGDFVGIAAIVWLCSLVLGVVSSTVAARTKTLVWPLLAPALWLVISIVLGVRVTWFAPYVGAGFVLAALGWLWTNTQMRARRVSAEILVNKSSSAIGVLSQAVAAALVALIAVSGGIGVTVLTDSGYSRTVVRDYIQPPLDVRTYPSALMKYRYYELDQKDATLFTVTGMPEDARLRLATMDIYDGNVFTVSNTIGSFVRTGENLNQETGDPVSVKVTVGDYSQPWVPIVADPTRITFGGKRAGTLSDSVYFNNSSSQIVLTTPLRDGDSFELTVDPQPVLTGESRDAAGASVPSSSSVFAMKGVPDSFVSVATNYTEGSKNAYEQLVALEHALQQGYYSNGEDGTSRSGHTTERLSSMFSSATLIGDDEQYATAMALMATSLGIPARVVLGFYPDKNENAGDNASDDGQSGTSSDSGDTWEVTGAHAHVWVEANFAGVGWLTFDPTPSRDRVPNNETPKPQPKPKPHVESPPTPPEQADQKDVLANQNQREDDSDSRWSVVLTVLKIAGITLAIVAILAAPFALIIFLKWRKRKARMNHARTCDRIAGAFSEVVDRARDTGFVAPLSNTRAQTAEQLQKIFTQAPITQMAAQVDAAVFGAAEPDLEDSLRAWHDADAVNEAMMATLPWYKRVLARISVKSLKASWPRRMQGVRARIYESWVNLKQRLHIHATKNSQQRGDHDSPVRSKEKEHNRHRLLKK